MPKPSVHGYSPRATYGYKYPYVHVNGADISRYTDPLILLRSLMWRAINFSWAISFNSFSSKTDCDMLVVHFLHKRSRNIIFFVIRLLFEFNLIFSYTTISGILINPTFFALNFSLPPMGYKLLYPYQKKYIQDLLACVSFGDERAFELLWSSIMFTFVPLMMIHYLIRRAIITCLGSLPI
jgi:hypothetical protein